MAQNTFGGVKRADLPDSAFVFPDERSFPVKTAQDVEDAVSSWGRYKGKHSFEEFKRRLKARAAAIGAESALPENWKNEMSQDDLEDALSHFGVLGMHWGRRKARVSTDSADSQAAKSLKKKRLSEMSNEELKKLNTRMQLEKQYKDLKSSDTSRGQRFLAAAVGAIGKQLINSAVSKGSSEAVNLLFKKAPVG